MGTAWHIRGRTVALDRPVIMGILNVTPDSFSDGGRFATVDAAVAQALTMCDAGADIIDVGGESTRPQGAQDVPADEERRRVVPVIERIARERPDATISVDTVKSATARAALDAGAHVVNDVSGLRLDPAMAHLCAERGAGLVLMHSRGGVRTMGTYADATYGDVVADVLSEMRHSVAAARAAGVADDQVVVDPGIGFAKKTEHSLALLAALPRLMELGYPVMVGLSRKRFIGEVTGVRDAGNRLNGTLGANVSALALGARMFRVHDVVEHRQALDMAWDILRRRDVS